MEIECEQRLTKVEESAKSAHHRLDTLESGQKEIRDLALSVNTLASSVKQLCEDVTDVNGRVKVIESKPGTNWEKLIWIVIAAAIGVAVGKLF